MEIVKYKKLHPDAIEPTKGSEKSAGNDLYAILPKGQGCVQIAPHTNTKIHTYLAIQAPKNTFGAIFPRSGLSINQGLNLANGVGICDEDYTGEYIIALHNYTDEMQTIHNGDRIAQLVFVPYIPVIFKEVEELDKTERGNGGFGSTGR